MKIIKLNPTSLEDLKGQLQTIDPDSQTLYFEGFDISLKGYYFEHVGHRFDVLDVMLDINEIPLLTVLRTDALEVSKDQADCEYDENSGCCVGEGSDMPGVYQRDERPYSDFDTEYMNHTGWTFSAGGRYAWNIPNIANGTLVGYYWVNLLGVIEDLRRD